MAFLPALLLSASACAAPTPPAALASVPESDSLAVVFASAESWDDFLDGVEVRRELWHGNWEEWSVSEEQLARAVAAGGTWRILAIFDESCSDSVNTIPILARLAQLLPDAELRIVESDRGRPWMEAHRSPDGRASTPTVLLLDEDHVLRGCWVEQPAGLAEFWLPTIPAGTSRQELPRKMAWYAEDAGQSTLEEFLLVMEAAAQGEMRCPGAE